MNYLNRRNLHKTSQSTILDLTLGFLRRTVSRFIDFSGGHPSDLLEARMYALLVSSSFMDVQSYENLNDGRLV